MEIVKCNYKLMYIKDIIMATVSPISGTIDTIFIADLSLTNLNCNNLTITISSGSIYVIDINESTQTVEFSIKDSIKGTKTITFTDGTTTDTIAVILELPQDISARPTFNVINAKRPQWPYRIY